MKFDERILKFARKQAEKAAKDPKKVKRILDHATIKAQTESSRLQGAMRDLKTLLALLTAWVRGEYRQIPWMTLTAALAAVIYFLNPLDLITDVIVGIGLVDDAFVIATVLSLIRKDIRHFEKWQQDRDNTIVVS